MKALVIGFGISGKAAAKLLRAKGYDVAASDRSVKESEDFEVFGEGEELNFKEFDLAVVSPGIRLDHPVVKRVRDAGVEVIGDVELGFRYLEKNRVLGVTGTNGKTTTVMLTTHILKEAGMKAVALGNVGVSVCEYALCPGDDILVVELSSFQLEKMQELLYFDAAVILNLTPNHLNWHVSMDEYAGAKLRIAKCLKPEGKLFVSGQVRRNFGVEGEVIENSAEAAARALSAFCNIEDVESAMKSFQKPPHRIEWVAEIDGVSYYNDSKASNVEAVLHAVRMFAGPIVLIAGGVDKGSTYTSWIEPFRGKVKKLIVFGESKDKMERELADFLAMEKGSTLVEAMGMARTVAEPGDTVLFSPACSSYDQFMSYEERGDTFKGEIRKWIGKK